MKDEGVCTKVAFAIQHQRYLWSQTYYRVSIETHVQPVYIGDKSVDLG